ncbi:cupin domain-containing protein [Maribacter sp. ACAM166]|uniref:cupin domain-containing protein n=1 Tax=Maribacter sp. ACAM166 TaxID=2508996 RepID=UPI0010FD2FC8|nr:cupin domain-containing protein [Maribacter sp. ACAM166]TLP73071.1 cupin [Maribacter sp. ACAM166]
MNITSFTKHLDFNEGKIITKVLLETSFSKEIRILLKQGQVMKEHKAPFPIIVHLIQGEIDFGVQGGVHGLKQGDILTLDSNIPHDLTAKEDSIVRLTLSKLDTAERVENVVTNS